MDGANLEGKKVQNTYGRASVNVTLANLHVVWKVAE